MCRMFAFTGENKSAFQEIYEALLEVSDKDPLSYLISRPDMHHKDGWGFVEYSSQHLRYERYSDAISEHELPEYHGDFMVIHARNASKGQPFGMMNSHPHFRRSGSLDLYLAHNGEIDKTRIQNGLSEEEMAEKTDSEVFLDLVASLPGNALQKLEGAIKVVYTKEALISSLNLFLIAVDRKKTSVKLYIYSDAASFNEFHQLHYFEGNGWRSVVSSSLPISGKFPSYSMATKLNPGKIYSLDKYGLKSETTVVEKALG